VDPPRPRFRRLTPEEIADKRANGQCYFCPEKFSRDHKCAARGGVFCIAMADSEDDNADISEEDVRISMHVLTGITSGDNIRLRVRIRGIELTALVDSGSTHTFIHDEVARRLGLAVEHQPGLTVKVANGEHIQSLGVCPATPVNIHGQQFSIDCYALALDGFDVVLGVQWLKTLGPITWDFSNLSMAFWHNGCSILWHGIGGHAVCSSGGHQESHGHPSTRIRRHLCGTSRPAAATSPRPPDPSLAGDAADCRPAVPLPPALEG